MPDFEITSPDGRRFVVTAPEGASEADVMAYAQANMGQAEAPTMRGRAMDAARQFLKPVDALRGFTRRMQGSQMLGWRDEAQAAANAALGGGSYRENLDAERAQTRQYGEDHPIAAPVADILGGLMAPIPPPGRAVTLPGRMAQGALVGAAAGAATGAGEAEGGAAEIGQGAMRGGAIGGAFGAALPGVIEGGARLGRGVIDAVSPTPSNVTANRLLLRNAGRDEVNLPEVVQAARTTDRPMMLADMLGPNNLGAAQAIARVPGEAQGIAARNLQNRMGEPQSERLAADVRRALSGTDFRQETAAILERRSAAARPLYDEAYRVELPRDLRLQRFLNDPDVVRGVREGVALARKEALARDEAFDLASLGIRFDDNGGIQIIGGGMPTRLFDIAKRGLDALIENNTNEFGKVNAQGRALVMLRNSMLDRLDTLNPAYGRARQAYAGETQSLDAMRVGRRLLAEGVEAADRTAEDIAKMSPGEREFFRIGVARGLLDKIENTTDAAEMTRLNGIFMRQGVRNRLRAAFDTDEEFADFTRRMGEEMQMALTNRAIAPGGGSQTQPMAERMRDLRNPPGGPMAEATGAQEPLIPRESYLARWASSGNTLPPVGVAIRNFFTGREENAFRRNAAEMAPILFTTNPAERVRAAEGLLNQSLSDARQAQMMAPIYQGLLRSGSVSGGLLAGDADAQRQRQQRR